MLLGCHSERSEESVRGSRRFFAALRMTVLVRSKCNQGAWDTMKYGFILMGEPLSVVELAQEAEEAGWDGVSLCRSRSNMVVGEYVGGHFANL